jgi:nitroreductase
MFIVITPFGLGPIQLIQRVIATAAGYNWVSVNAFNPWALVGIGEPSLATSGYLAWSDDRLPLLLGIPAVVIGTVLLAAGFLAGFFALLRDDSRRRIVIATVFLSLAFFVLPTRVHERYLFPAFAFLPLLAVVSSRWGIALVVLAVSTFINFHGVLTAGQYATPELRDLALGSTFRTTPFIVLSVLGHLAVFLFAAYRLGLGRSLFARRRIVPDAEEPDPWQRADEPERSDREVHGYDGSLRRRGFPSPARRTLVAASAASSAGPGAGALPDDLPAWREEIGRGGRAAQPSAFATLDDAAHAPGSGSGDRSGWRDDDVTSLASEDHGGRRYEPSYATVGVGAAGIAARRAGRGFFSGFLSRFETPSLRRDRSEQLRREGGGRFSRLDLFLVVLLMLAALGSRTWRLEEPYDMHFDEVYHARTATEFLQDWRYDMPHSIYEFTHPHLAKYLIAGGLVAFGNDRVTAESRIQATVEDAAIETRWSTREQPELRNGDRLYVATGTDVKVYDLTDRGLVATIASPAVAVAVGDDSHTLYLADAAGRVSRVSTLWLDLLREPPLPGEDPIDAEELTPEPMASLGGTPVKLVATPDGSAVVGILDGGRVVSVSTATGARTANVTINGGTALTAFGSGDTVYVTPAEVADLDADLARAAEILDKDAGTLRRQVDDAQRRGFERVAIAAFMTKEQRDAIREATSGEELVGIDVEGGNAVAVGDARGVALLDPSTLRQLARVDVGAPVRGRRQAACHGPRRRRERAVSRRHRRDAGDDPRRDLGPGHQPHPRARRAAGQGDDRRCRTHVDGLRGGAARQRGLRGRSAAVREPGSVGRR